MTTDGFHDGSAIELTPAASFTIDELVAIYNQTRIDYIVPMPMNSQRLAEYIRLYDVNLDASFVAKADGDILGLAMLGVRRDHAWVTRLGVLPNRRKGGIGRALMVAMVEAARQHWLKYVQLEVILNNTPAHKLFLALGFEQTNQLLVMRRPPGPVKQSAVGSIEWLDWSQLQRMVRQQPQGVPWTNQADSYDHMAMVEGCRINLADGSRGWCIFRRQPLVLSHIRLHTEAGDPNAVGSALLAHVHQRHSRLDTQAENIRCDDPHLAAYEQHGYIEAFQRIEMLLNLVANERVNKNPPQSAS